MQPAPIPRTRAQPAAPAAAVHVQQLSKVRA